MDTLYQSLLSESNGCDEDPITFPSPSHVFEHPKNVLKGLVAHHLKFLEGKFDKKAMPIEFCYVSTGEKMDNKRIFDFAIYDIY